jgi:hypothetical protein
MPDGVELIAAERKLEVLNFGAGVQSTTLLLMSCEGLLPKLDRAIFADTQWEPAAVYRHLEWCKEHAAKHGITIDVRTAGNLRQDLIEFWGQRRSADGKRHASIPAFIKNPDGSRGMVRRQCTGTYKIDVIERYVREEVLGLKRGQRWPLEPRVRQWIGISTDEAGRMKRSLRPAVAMWHPLIESDAIARIVPGRMFPVGYSRQDCLEWLDRHGYPRPPRSACIGCPFHRNEEWVALTPAEFADACEVDRLIRVGDRERIANAEATDLVGEPYLHGSLLPLAEVDLGRDDVAGQGFENECAGVCGV